MKGMSLTMQIVIVVIILLVTAMVVLSVFGMQFGGISDTIGSWISGVPSTPHAEACGPKGEDACTLPFCRKCCKTGTTDFDQCVDVTGSCPINTVSC